MSATIIPFPSRLASQADALTLLAERLAAEIGDLPPVEDEQLKLLRRIDRKLNKLVKAIGRGGEV